MGNNMSKGKPSKKLLKTCVINPHTCMYIFMIIYIYIHTYLYTIYYLQPVSRGIGLYYVKNKYEGVPASVLLLHDTYVIMFFADDRSDGNKQDVL